MEPEKPAQILQVFHSMNMEFVAPVWENASFLGLGSRLWIPRDPQDESGVCCTSAGYEELEEPELLGLLEEPDDPEFEEPEFDDPELEVLEELEELELEEPESDDEPLDPDESEDLLGDLAAASALSFLAAILAPSGPLPARLSVR